MRLKPASSLDRETKPSAAMSSLKPRCSLAKVAEESGSSTFSEMAEAVMRTGTHSSVDRPDARPELLRRRIAEAHILQRSSYGALRRLLETRTSQNTPGC